MPLCLALLSWQPLASVEAQAATDEFGPDVEAAPVDPNDEIGFGSEPIVASPAATTDSNAPASHDDALGFGSEPIAVSAQPAAETSTLSDEPSPFRLSATLRFQSAIRTETDIPDRIAKLRQVLDLGLEYKRSLGAGVRLRVLAGVHTEADFSYLANLSDYDIVTIDSQAWKVWPGETFLSLAWSALEFSTGYQIINLGQAEMISLLDLVNARDLREPLPTDTSNMRLPALTTRLGLSFDPIRVEAIAVHEAFFGLLPPPLGEFSPFRQLLLDNPAVGTAFSGRTLRNQNFPARDLAEVAATQLYGRLTWAGSGFDLVLLAGSTLDRIGLPSLPTNLPLTGPILDLPLVHPRYTVLGQSGAVTLGPVLLRWELTFDVARPLAVQHTDSTFPNWSGVRRDMASGLLGLGYAPSMLTSTALELSQSYVFYNPARSPELQLAPLFPVEATQIAFRFNQSFLSDRANLGFVFLLFGVSPVNAWAARLEVSYALTDQLEVAIGYVTYQPTRHFGFFYGLTEHDRAFLNLRLGFGS
jgi:hypothetical protein